MMQLLSGAKKVNLQNSKDPQTSFIPEFFALHHTKWLLIHLEDKKFIFHKVFNDGEFKYKNFSGMTMYITKS